MSAAEHIGDEDEFDPFDCFDAFSEGAMIQYGAEQGDPPRRIREVMKQIAEGQIEAERPTKSKRGRPVGETTRAIRDAVLKLTGCYKHVTVRQAFYQLEGVGVVEKTEGGYRQVQKQIKEMRRNGELPWSFITDGTRYQRKPATFADAKDAITEMAGSWRKDLWQSQGVRIEVWLEKDALAGLVYDATWKWDVSLMVSRGQSSVTFLHNAALAAEEAWLETGVTTYIYSLYDHDAGGERSARTIERDLQGFAPAAPIVFKLLALSEEQIEAWNLPTRPPKAKDPEAAKWGNRPAVELDAIDPTQLTELVEQAIESHVDVHAWEVEKALEAEEKKGFLALAEGFGS